ncbi:hypothetical protein B0O99DRAFT_649936 [Bisporella sp. PMI_857]|nr:hypothetical protein B0O99DRAFT_649936 [Bisporella sp. PMI_857]
MASDEDYAAFLERANQDPGEGFVKSDAATKKKGFELRATDQGEVPAVLRSKKVVDAFYVSDSDEPFEPVSLALPSDTKTLPDEVAFAKLVDHPEPTSAGVEILDIGEWDAHGQYKDVVDATREATEGSDVRVYRVRRDGARVEYWVVGVKDGRLLGVRTLAIES